MQEKPTEIEREFKDNLDILFRFHELPGTEKTHVFELYEHEMCRINHIKNVGADEQDLNMIINQKTTRGKKTFAVLKAIYVYPGNAEQIYQEAVNSFNKKPKVQTFQSASTVQSGMLTEKNTIRYLIINNNYINIISKY